jgi:hypothetical protein
MFAIELRSFGFIARKTWENLADVRGNKTKGPKLDSEDQLRSPMF